MLTNTKAQHSRQAGFTLLEIVVATTITVIMMIAATGLFLTTIRTNNKGAQISSIKSEGDYALSQIEFLLRNATAIVVNPAATAAPACASGMTNISLKLVDGGTTTLSNLNGLIASKSATAATAKYLTSPAATLSNLTFDCTQAGKNYGTYVTVSFTLAKDEANSNQPNTQTQDFKTSVNVRSY